MALSANALVKTKLNTGEYFLDLIVKSGVTIYQGALVAIETSTGHITKCATSLAGEFAGIATEKVVGDGVLKCRVQVAGLFQFTLSGTTAAVTDIGKPVYASADDTVTLTSTNNILIGAIVQYVASDSQILIAMKPPFTLAAAYA